MTAEFLACASAGCSPYQLVRRVKSPESLARKIRDWQGSNARRPIDDLLRYTVLTESPDELVAAAVQTADALTERGWQVAYAMHSYTDGSRYKGLHAYLRTPDISRIEIQWHSIASVQDQGTDDTVVRDRSQRARDRRRADSRPADSAWRLSAQLRPPDGIDDLTELGGKRVAVNNYSDSRRTAATNEGPALLAPAPRTAHRPTTAFEQERRDRAMKLYLVKEDERLVWVAALAHEQMYAYVANTGKFHDNNALRNDYYMERWFSYEEIGSAEARRLIDQGVGTLNEDDHSDALH